MTCNVLVLWPQEKGRTEHTAVLSHGLMLTSTFGRVYGSHLPLPLKPKEQLAATVHFCPLCGRATREQRHTVPVGNLSHLLKQGKGGTWDCWIWRDVCVSAYKFSFPCTLAPAHPSSAPIYIFGSFNPFSTFLIPLHVN